MRRKKAIIFVEYRHKLEAIDSAKKAGFATILVAQKNQSEASKFFDEVFQIEWSDRAAVNELVKILKAKFNTKAVVSNYDHFVVQRSYLAERLGVPATTVYAACCTRNKALMRHALSLMPENIDFENVTTLAEAREARENLGGDVFLKSISGVKSRCVFHVDSRAKLDRAWQEFNTLKNELDQDLYEDFRFFDFRFRYPDPRQTVLVEKATPGQQITIASLVDSHRVWHAPNVCDIYTAADIGRDDSFLAFRILPSRQPIPLIREAKTVTETMIRVLGLRNCGIHAELIVTPTGEMKIIEIASRIGGYRTLMYSHAYDFYLPDLLIRAVTGQPVRLRKKAKKFVSLLELFPVREGDFVEIKNWQKLARDPSIEYKLLKAKKGERLGLARENFPPAAVLLVAGKNYREVYEKSLALQKELEVVVK